MTERDELVGKMSLVSRLPQYLNSEQMINGQVFDQVRETHLITAMLTGAEAVAWYTDMVVG